MDEHLKAKETFENEQEGKIDIYNFSSYISMGKDLIQSLDDLGLYFINIEEKGAQLWNISWDDPEHNNKTQKYKILKELIVFYADIKVIKKKLSEFSKFIFKVGGVRLYNKFTECNKTLFDDMYLHFFPLIQLSDVDVPSNQIKEIHEKQITYKNESKKLLDLLCNLNNMIKKILVVCSK